MKTVSLLSALYFLLLLSGCEKTVTLRLDDTSPKLVVEATIENDQPPVVVLSKSINFFSGFTPAVLEENFVHGAEIFVSNGALVHRLKEYTVLLPGGISIYYYSADSTAPATFFTGELNKKYSLTIISEGLTYTAETTIPDTTRRIDSIFWRQAPPGNDPQKVMLMVRAQDRQGLGDYIRYFTKRNREPFYPGINSVYDDQLIDGSSYEVQIERGVDRNTSRQDDDIYFNKGDTVTFKLCQIDKATFDFWRTMEYNYTSLGNPFSTPTRVLSNIRGHALGYFGGYAARFRSLVIPL